MSAEPALQPFTERHQEVLKEAMRLIAERGLAGASLRELARRVHVSQPSLYHYFDSKDALVQQIIAWYSARTIGDHMAAVQGLARPVTLRALLRFVPGRVAITWSRPQHMDFVRFLFGVTMERPEVGRLFQEMVLDRGHALCRVLGDPLLEQCGLQQDEFERGVTTCFNALIMDLMQDRMLHMPKRRAGTVDEYIDFLVDVVLRGLSARAETVAPCDCEDKETT